MAGQPSERRALTDEQLQRSFEQAVAFSSQADLLQAISVDAWDTQFWDDARRDPGAFLASRGVSIPDGLGVNALDDPLQAKPSPDYEFFTIRMFNCRKMVVRKENGTGFEIVEFCRGFEIVPHPFPGGPVANR